MSNIPARYADAKYDDVPEKVKEAMREMFKTRRGIYIYGDVGTGKTHIVYALYAKMREAGKKVIFRNTVELFKDMRDEFGRGTYDKKHPVDTLLESDAVLVLDDIGVEKATDFVVESLYLIINKRYNEMRPCIITSNYSLDALADRVGDRIASRIAESCVVVHLTGKDRRLEAVQ